MLKYSLGIDISMKDFHVCLSVIDNAQEVTIKGSRTFANSASGFKELDAWINNKHKQKDIPLHITLEATGVYYESCAYFLFKKGYAISVVLPNKARRYLQASGHKSKNDKIDAAGLAQMGAEKKLDLWQPLNDFYYTLRSYTRHHESLQNMKTNVSNQLHADMASHQADKQIVRQLKTLIKTIQKQIAETKRLVENHLSLDASVQQKVAGICRIKGLGILSVATVLAETNGFLLFSNIAQLVSFAGYDVIDNQSGSHTGKTRISKKGNTHIRRILHMPALNVVRFKESLFVDLYNRTLQRHNIKMKSYVAVQKKLLVIIYSLWKREEAFKPDYNPILTTREEEVKHSSGLNFEEVVYDKQKSSPDISRDYTRYTTIEVSATASSGLLQN